MKIFDPLRRKEVECTPEERVRQWAIGMLAGEMKVPLWLMASEYPFKFNSLNCRADIVVFDRKAAPVMLVECKAPDVELKDEVVAQVARYNTVIKARYIMITNGGNTYICRHNPQSGKFDFLTEAPLYEDMIR